MCDGIFSPVGSVEIAAVPADSQGRSGTLPGKSRIQQRVSAHQPQLFGLAAVDYQQFAGIFSDAVEESALLIRVKMPGAASFGEPQNGHGRKLSLLLTEAENGVQFNIYPVKIIAQDF